MSHIFNILQIWTEIVESYNNIGLNLRYMREADDILIQLVRLSLNLSRELLDFNSVTGEMWGEVIDISFKQGVSAIAAIGLVKYLDNNKGAVLTLDSEKYEGLKYEWLGEILNAEEDFSKHKAILLEITNLLSEQNIKILLLKGLSLSDYYPYPQYRTIGDMDIYSYGSHHQIDKIFRDKLSTIDNKSPKHSVIEYHGVMIENHYIYLCSYMFRCDLKVQSFLETLDEDIINKGGYYTPSPLKNYFLLLCHMAHHFSDYGSITLRHILDWGLFLKAEADNLDIAFVHEKLQEFDLVKTNDLFVSLAEWVCGLDFSKFIFIRLPEKECTRVLEYIMADKKRTYPNQLFPRIWYKLKILASNNWKFRYLAITMRERVWYSVKLHLTGKVNI